MLRLVEVCIRRPVFASMLVATLVVVGIAGFMRLSRDRVPKIDLPTVSVRTTVPGASTEEVETLVSQRIEEAVNTIEGIDQLRSISTTGSSLVIATFRLERPIDVATQDVRDRVATVLRDLPREAEPPIISKFDSDASPILTLALSADRPVRELTELADKLLKPALERVTGVGEVRINGGAERAASIEVDADRLRAYGLSIAAVRDALVRENSEIPGGAVTGEVRESVLRTMGRLTTPRAFEDLPIAVLDGATIRVRDVARVEDGTKEVRSIARLDGQPCVALEIRRQSGANTVEAIEGVKARLSSLAAELPADVRVQILRDQSRYIDAALAEIESHLVGGSILATLVVLLFMRSWRSTIIAAIAIPTSVIATFGVMDALGFTLNGVTMLALVLMVGIVIDDAIVVLENIFRFIEERGLSPVDAAREGTAEIALAVTATTLSLVVIFVPVSFMSSVSGRFLYEFGITAAAAVMVSLLVSFTLTPMMSSRLLRRVEPAGGGARSRRGPYALLERAYMALLRLALRQRFAVAGLAIAVVASTVPIYGRVKQEYAPTNVDEAEFEVTISGPEGANLAAMDAVMREVESLLMATPGVSAVLATTGGGFISSVSRGEAYVRLTPHTERVPSVSRFVRELLSGTPGQAFAGNISQGEIMRDVRRRLGALSDVRCAVRNLQAFNLGTGPFEIDFSILGPDLDSLSRYGEELRTRAKELGGIQDPDTTLRLDRPELHAVIDRERAADLGVSILDVATALRLSVGGEERASRFRDPDLGEDYDVQIRLQLEDRAEPGRIAELWVPARGGALVPLSSVARLEPATSASRIDRLDRQRQVSLRASVGPGYALADRLAALRQAAAQMDMPPAYTTRVSGRGRELERTIGEFLWAFLLSVVLMYVILASQFESLVHPFTILLSLPLSVPFALWSLDVSGSSLNLYSALGILVLFGVVKKNAILQIDHTIQLRARGLERAAAILQANRDRLRPILMTTLSLVAGMLPLWVGTGPGAEERRTIAVVVIGGQSLSLFLTLIVTPVAYSLFDDVGALFRRRRQQDVTPAAPAAPVTTA
ncbi:MAG: efflux RND transporter permease subunit [Planctomycetes bacterium]|nr:efflux RND transporter permease subunit [Planctomycetota bacterium]